MFAVDLSRRPFPRRALSAVGWRARDPEPKRLTASEVDLTVAAQIGPLPAPGSFRVVGPHRVYAYHILEEIVFYRMDEGREAKVQIFLLWEVSTGISGLASHPLGMYLHSVVIAFKPAPIKTFNAFVRFPVDG